MEYFCISDTGLIREKNQDAYLAIENQYGDLLLLVADGIGGGKAGEIASNETIKYFNNIFKQSGPFDNVQNIVEYLKMHVKKANSEVYKLSLSNANYYGMGTTLTGLLLSKSGNVCINCGDSRCYGFLNNEICQLTFDHTLVNEMLLKKQITAEEAINHPKRHYLIKAMGIYDNVNPDIHEVNNYDYYLVCSDGLHSYVSDIEIKDIVLNNNFSVEEKTYKLKDLSLLKGGYDNITAILVKA